MAPRAVVALGVLWSAAPSASTANECIGWSQDQPGNPPPPREAHSAIYDSAHRRLVVFGGLNQPYIWRNDTWALPLDSPSDWSEVVTTGSAPSPRARHSAIYDPIRDRMIVFGGMDVFYNGVEQVERYFGEVWALSLSGDPVWTRLAPSGPAPPIRAGHSAVYDPIRDRMVIIGGYRREYLGLGLYRRIVYEDTWTLSLAGEGSWQQLPIPTLPPYTGVFAASAYDPIHDRIVLINDDGPDLWTLSLASGSGWIQAPVTGDRGFGRIARIHAAFDATDDRLLFTSDLFGMSALSLDVDTLRWTPLTIYGPPHYPYDHIDAGIVFDPVRRRMIYACGNPSNQTLAAEVLPGRIGLLVTVLHPNRGSIDLLPAMSCYRPGESVVITATPGDGYVFDDWDGDAKGNRNPLKVVMDRPQSIRADFDHYTSVLLSQFDVDAVAGGIELRWRFADEGRVQAVRVERAPGAEGPWTERPLETRVRNGVTSALDPEADREHPWFYRLVARLQDGTIATLGPIALEAAESVRESAITNVSPNPSEGVTRIQFTVARAGRVRLVLVDIAGRRVATLIDAEHRPGRLTALWDGAGDSGRVRPGTYFLRLSTLDRDAVQRLVIVR